MNRSTPGLPVHHQLLESTQTHTHCVGDDIQPSHPLSSPSPHVLNLSQHQGLSNESALCIRWPKYWSFSFNISPFNEHPGLIFRVDWLDLLAVPWTATCQASLSITKSQSLFKLMSIQLVIPTNHLILCHPLLLHLQSFPASGSFPLSQFFVSGGQSIGVSASASVLQCIFRTNFL